MARKHMSAANRRRAARQHGVDARLCPGSDRTSEYQATTLQHQFRFRRDGQVDGDCVEDHEDVVGVVRSAGLLEADSNV